MSSSIGQSWRKLVVPWASCLVLALAILQPVPVNAADGGSDYTFTAPGCGDNPIHNGLWAGINAAFGSNYGCTDNADNANQSDQSSVLPQPNSVYAGGSYVALGDSVAAGLGLPLAPDADPVCGVSTQAYSATVASTLGMPYRNIACSGATAGDLFTEQHLRGTARDIAPQIKTAFAGGQPSLITITAGANDIYWPYFISRCYMGDCGSRSDEAMTSTLLSVLRLKLDYVLTDIGNSSNGQPPQVILTGYYHPLSSACVNQPRITGQEVAWLNGKTDAINQAISDVASRYPFARFAPVDFGGHELCTADPWVQDVNAPAPFHPTASGQQAIAQAVLAQVRH